MADEGIQFGVVEQRLGQDESLFPVVRFAFVETPPVRHFVLRPVVERIQRINLFRVQAVTQDNEAVVFEVLTGCIQF